MSITFTKPTTGPGWSSALEDIVAAGRAAMQAKNRNDLSAANAALNAYIDALNDSTFWSHDLDHAARAALGYFAVDIATATVADLASRTDALRQLANTINATAADNEAAAADIRHEKLVQALTTAMDAAKAARELQVAVQNIAADKNIVDAAGDLLDAISKFNDVVTKVNSQST